MSSADQFLFGYDNGHSLLTASRELRSATLVRLLGATDAAMAPGSGPLVTGLALEETREFAFCVTWTAPEALRPGAVWAHAVVVGEAELRDPRACDVLVGLPRRPRADGSDLSAYRIPLPLGGPPNSPSYLPLAPLDLELLGNLISTAYSATGGIVVHQNLAAGAAALLAVWRTQWPELRAGFSFRTRELVRRGASDFDLTVTAKLRGFDGYMPASPARSIAPAWVAAVAEDAASSTQTGLREFLSAFGPQEPRDLRRLRRLAGLWLHVAAEDAPRARAHLERYWPRPRSGAALKKALFGRGNTDWWRLDEATRVSTLLQTTDPAWDLNELELADRARALVEAGPTRSPPRHATFGGDAAPEDLSSQATDPRL